MKRDFACIVNAGGSKGPMYKRQSGKFLLLEKCEWIYNLRMPLLEIEGNEHMRITC